MAAESPYRRANAAARARLHALVERLSDEDLRRPLGDRWTVAAALAHLAFWGRYAGAALDTWERTGVAPRTGVADEINAAALPAWLALPVSTAATMALDAADEVDRRIERLPADLVATILAAGRTRLLDRSLHRDAHGEVIGAALPGGRG